MKAYVIAADTVHDAAVMAEYGKVVAATITAFDGKFLVRGGTCSVLEGEWQKRTVILEFPSRERAEAWYNSDDYQKIIGLRLNSAHGSLVIVDGV
ncbi:DUF1330 domain-containing protein [Bradyrhizobium sp.]|uniref:DUF1330 domain-containing protein n=1 Tax=Bradyrhizobium sp. TaxID=376 RepID=UPI002D6FED08|nr:DUF1330 domain-containing protein [Bradyrhizobium sp.]HZR72675.1 DUF1330 domain-containing protein [Bradyrhizobium sp.]